MSVAEVDVVLLRRQIADYTAKLHNHARTESDRQVLLRKRQRASQALHDETMRRRRELLAPAEKLEKARADGTIPEELAPAIAFAVELMRGVPEESLAYAARRSGHYTKDQKSYANALNVDQAVS